MPVNAWAFARETIRAGSILFLFATVVFLAPPVCPDCLAGGTDEAYSPGQKNKAHNEYSRIVSLAPSVTETLFMLGLGDRVVGVTRYCMFPPAAQDKPKVGGYSDPNYEAVVSLRPDLIVMLPEHGDYRKNLARLGPDILVADHRDISGILESILAIGRTCGKELAAETAVEDIRVRMDNVRGRVSGLALSRVLICVGRNMGSGRIKDVYIAGNRTLYNDLIRLAGGVNAYCGNTAYPMVSREGIMRINPEVIIDMVPDLDEKGLDRNMVLEEWHALGRVDAVRNNRVHVFGQDYTVVPGPRFILILEEMAWVLHPEADLK